MALDTIDKLVAALAVSHKRQILKTSLGSQVAGGLCSLWRATGAPAPPAIPTAHVTCDNNTAGGFILPANVAGKSLYLGKWSASNSVVGQLLLCDRLAHMGGLNGTLATPQTVACHIRTAATQGRCDARGRDVWWSSEHYTATGSTARNLTATYIYVDPNPPNNEISGAVSPVVAWAASVAAGRVHPITPSIALGDGIVEVQSVTLSGTTGTAGNFGITARKILAELPIPVAGSAAIADFAALALPKLTGLECLEVLVLCNTTSSGNVMGTFDLIQA